MSITIFEYVLPLDVDKKYSRVNRSLENTVKS